MSKKYKNYDITLVVTHRCNAKCIMCSSYKNPSCVKNEITLEDIDSSRLQVVSRLCVRIWKIL